LCFLFWASCRGTSSGKGEIPKNVSEKVSQKKGQRGLGPHRGYTGERSWGTIANGKSTGALKGACGRGAQNVRRSYSNHVLKHLGSRRGGEERKIKS